MFLKIQGHKTLNKSQETQSWVLNYTSLNHSVPPRNLLYSHQTPLLSLYGALNLAFLTEYFVCNNKISLLKKKKSPRVHLILSWQPNPAPCVCVAVFLLRLNSNMFIEISLEFLHCKLWERVIARLFFSSPPTTFIWLQTDKRSSSSKPTQKWLWIHNTSTLGLRA